MAILLDMAKQIFGCAVEAANPQRGVLRHCEGIRSLYSEGGFSRLLVIGFGKASPAMALAMEECLGDIIDSGVVITKYGHASRGKLKKIRLYEADHPIPDEDGVEATKRVMDMVSGADEKTLVVTLVSGGGSALLVAPFTPVTLAEKQMTTDLLLKAGADIGELNTVRKHLSRVKGGRLAEMIYPATSVSLILSDVIGDRLDIIASGPTAPDPTTFSDALSVLAKYGLVKKVPESVQELLVKGQTGMAPETTKPGNAVFAKVSNVIIGSNLLALEAAKEKAEDLGFRSEILSAEISGEAREAAAWLARKALEAKRSLEPETSICLVSGGETTVTVRGKGKGGRNMELALSFAVEIEGESGITFLSAGTDGTDGPTDAAGAVVDGNTAGAARLLGADPLHFLVENDSYNFFKTTGELLVTGPTGTNVMDVQITLIGHE
jgi:glycerate 2-kinase